MKTPNQTGSRREFLLRAARAASGLAIVPLLEREAVAQGNLFANPPDLVRQGANLHAVIQLSDAMRSVPNAGQLRLRMFQGWQSSGSPAVPDAAVAGPGPTLRARVGGRMDILLLNRIDDSHFAYSLDTSTNSEDACDASGTVANAPGGNYPFVDAWPNCFHGSSTANIHFHGTHTDPNGLGDNVLVQVIPDRTTSPDEWGRMLAEVFAMPHPPAHWAQMPASYQIKQLGYTAAQFLEAAKTGKKLAPAGLVAEHDKFEIAKAKRDGRTPPGSLWDWDAHQVTHGEWPQYIIGAYPNIVILPDYDKGGFEAGQAPGTHWYHAHKHGSTSLHIFNGLAGAIIVEGDYDDKIRAFFQKQMPANTKFTENVLVFQQIVTSQNLEKSAQLGDNPRSGNNQKLINGKINPTFQMRPGEIQLWRFVNAMGGGGKGTLDPTLFNAMIHQGFAIRQVAMDGVQFAWDNYRIQPFVGLDGAAPQYPFGLTLASGNRADLLVKAPSTPQTFRFTIPGDLNNVSGTPFLVCTVEVVQGPDLGMKFFTDADEHLYPKLPHYLNNLPPPLPGSARTLAFAWDRGPGPNPNPPKFTINGKQFLENSHWVDQCMRRNTIEDWNLTNPTFNPPGKGPSAVHPFHIHINPFQIIQVQYLDNNGKLQTYTPSGPPVWQDTIGIPPGGSVLIRHKFADFTGTYVLHCHILAHEDRGMMELVRVIPERAPISACAVDHIAHH